MSFGVTQDYKREAVRSAAILTNSFVAGTTIENTHMENQIIVLVQFTIGSLTSAEIKVEFSPENSTFYQETFGAVSGATETDVLGEHTITATGNYRIPVAAKDRFIKISAKGTGTVTSSSMTLEVIRGIA